MPKALLIWMPGEEGDAGPSFQTPASKGKMPGND
jgi:hypothetical protein